VVHEGLRRERLDAALHEHRGHGRTGIRQRPHAGDVARPLALSGGEVVEERRRQIQRGQPLAFHGVQCDIRAELGLAAEHAAAGARRQQRPHAHRVVQRHDAERAVARPQLELDELRQGRRGARPRCERGTPFGRPVVPEV